MLTKEKFKAIWITRVNSAWPASFNDLYDEIKPYLKEDCGCRREDNVIYLCSDCAGREGSYCQIVNRIGVADRRKEETKTAPLFERKGEMYSTIYKQPTSFVWCKERRLKEAE